MKWLKRAALVPLLALLSCARPAAVDATLRVNQEGLRARLFALGPRHEGSPAEGGAPGISEGAREVTSTRASQLGAAGAVEGSAGPRRM